MIQFKSTLTAYSISHFIVDFACAFLLIGSIAKQQHEITYLFLLYNFAAFALQMPLGVIADRQKNPVSFAVLGCLLIVPAYFLTSVPLLCVILAGLGNALFHIGGGTKTLRRYLGQSAPLGIFIAPGALGIFLGSSSFILSQPLTYFPVFLLIAAAFLLYTADGRSAFLNEQAPEQRSRNSSNVPLELVKWNPGKVLMPLGCFFLVVLLRSFTGTIMTFPWKSTTVTGALLVTAVILGKALGGFFADKIGVIRTTILSLSIASVLFLFSSVSIAGLIAVFLFNMTMPITLWAAADLMKKHEGFSFGLLTFALFIGYSIPTALDTGKLFLPWFYMLLALVSFVFLMFGLVWRKANGR